MLEEAAGVTSCVWCCVKRLCAFLFFLHSLDLLCFLETLYPTKPAFLSLAYMAVILNLKMVVIIQVVENPAYSDQVEQHVILFV